MKISESLRCAQDDLLKAFSDAEYGTEARHSWSKAFDNVAEAISWAEWAENHGGTHSI